MKLEGLASPHNSLLSKAARQATDIADVLDFFSINH